MKKNIKAFALFFANTFRRLLLLGTAGVILIVSACEPFPQKNQSSTQQPVQQSSALKIKGGLRAPPTETPYTLEYFEPTPENPEYGTLKVNDHAFLVPEGVTRPSIVHFALNK